MQHQLGRYHIQGPSLFLSTDLSQPHLLGCDLLHPQHGQKCLEIMRTLQSHHAQLVFCPDLQVGKWGFKKLSLPHSSSPSQCWGPEGGHPISSAALCYYSFLHPSFFSSILSLIPQPTIRGVCSLQESQ